MQGRKRGRVRNGCWRAHLGLCVLLALAGCASFAYLTEVQPPHFPTAHDCAKCHVTVHAEWAASRHATAWTEPRFVAATGGHRFTACLGCHAPQPYATEDPPAARAWGRHEGVTCVSCHLRDGSLVGPYQPTGRLRPHPITVDPNFGLDGSLCGRCHAGPWAQWRATPETDRPSCRTCHMPPLRIKVTQATNQISRIIVALEERVTVHQHRFAIETGPEVRDRLGLTVTPDPNGALRLTLHNGLPHALPTGDFGLRLVAIEISALDAANAATPLVTTELIPERDTALAAGASRAWILHPPEDGTALRVRLVRRTYPDRPEQILLERRLAL